MLGSDSIILALTAPSTLELSVWIMPRGGADLDDSPTG